MYQYTHEGSHGRWTASVYALRKWLETWNTDPDITTLFTGALLYITGKVNYLPQCPNLSLHSEIICIGWLSMILGFIQKSLTRTQQTYFTHIGIKITGLKCSSQLITQILKIVYG